MTDLLVVLMTAPSQDKAEQIVSALVAENIVACGNITMAVNSIYRWQGEIERASEVLVLFKTTRARYPALQARVSELHPYDVPELIALPAEAALAAYADWVKDSVGG